MDNKHWILVFMVALYTVTVSSKKMNVLFIVADDMRPQLGAYLGKDFPSPVHPPVVHTPNLDKLASRSLLLKRAYVQQSVCSPSRTSFLTGRRPDTTHVYDLDTYFREVGGNFTTIPQYFKENGYRSLGMGKIFHQGAASGYDDPISWSGSYFHPKNNNNRYNNKDSWFALSKDEASKKPLPDKQIADRAIKTLKRVANKRTPFFLAVGFQKPHLPFVFPEEYLDLYPAEDISLPENNFAPVDMPSIAWNRYAELKQYEDIKELSVTGQINSTMPLFKIKELRRAYYSAVAYTDFLIGKVLQELENLGIVDSTIVSFLGDHGFQLGENGEWCKGTNFDLATHAPMMIRIPQVTDHGISTRELTEFVDLFPTLVEAAGLDPLPICPADSGHITRCVEGRSMIPLIKNPSGPWKERAFSQYPRGDDVMGYSMKTDKYRYSEWVGFSGAPNYQPDWNDVSGVELYDHDADPQENYNQAGNPDMKKLVEELSDQLHAGWRQDLP